MLDTDYEQQQYEIHNILQAAGEYGLEEEVWVYAHKYIDDDPTIDILQAYYDAFNEWVK